MKENNGKERGKRKDLEDRCKRGKERTEREKRYKGNITWRYGGTQRSDYNESVLYSSDGAWNLTFRRVQHLQFNCDT